MRPLEAVTGVPASPLVAADEEEEAAVQEDLLLPETTW